MFASSSFEANASSARVVGMSILRMQGKRVSEASSWGRPAAGGSLKTDLPYNAANIANDLNPKTEKPVWPLSCYAPFKHETTLIGGLDVSPEEMRVKAVVALRAGNANEYVQYEAGQIAAAEQAHAAARNNSTEAFQQAARQSKLLTNTTNPALGSTAFGKNVLPSAFASSSTPSAFGNATTTSAPPATATPAFGQSTFGQASFSQPGFGQSAFGQTSTPASTSFGQPAGGAQPMSTFGQPSTATTTPAFGQSAFGQAGQLGVGGSSITKPASGAFGAFAGTGASAFGVGATPSNAIEGSGGGSGFSAFAGQPSAFGLAASTRGNTSNTSNNTVTGGSVFGQPTFGQPANTTFSAPSTFGQQQQQGNAFSSLTNNTNDSNTGSVFGSFGVMSTASTNQSASVFNSSGQTLPQGSSAVGNLNTTSTAQPQARSVFGQPAHSTSSGLAPSISMASSTSGGVSAFPAPSPMSTFNQSFSRPLSSPLSSTPKTTINFAAAIAQTTYRPGSTPYDSQLPPNYEAMLPLRAGEAFKRERFSWAWKDDKGAVPEWVPPVDVR